MMVVDDRWRFCFNDTATTEIYTLSLHDALPICGALPPRRAAARADDGVARRPGAHRGAAAGHAVAADGGALDRKSTRLNSSHANISYAVFCLKKKIKTLHTFACATYAHFLSSLL